MEMVACVSKKTMHCFNGLNPYADQASLRHRAFGSLGWNISCFDNDEWEEDIYDMSPKTEYLVYYDKNQIARGCVRLGRTDVSYNVDGRQRSFMLNDVFNGSADAASNLLFSYGILPSGEDVREGTRFAVDACLLSGDRKQSRARVVSQLTVGLVEYALQQGVTKIVGVMQPAVWNSVWTSRGCAPAWLGPEVIVDGKDHIRAGSLDITSAILQKMRQRTGIHKSALHFTYPHRNDPEEIRIVDLPAAIAHEAIL